MLVFYEDRSDVARRALPRLAVGIAGWCLLVIVGFFIWGGAATVPTVPAVMGGIGLLVFMTRFDVIALQFGRPIRYELHADRFLAYRGSRLVESFEYSDVSDWVAADAASTLWYWLGWGYYRSRGFFSVLDQYCFTVTERGSGRRRTLSPPALFRWEDRGGLEDVTQALVKRLGPPINSSVNYFVDKPRT